MKKQTIKKAAANMAGALIFVSLIGCTPTLADDTSQIESGTSVQAQIEWQPWTNIPLDFGIQGYIHDLCEEHNLAYSLIIALIDTESKFNVDVVSDAGDYGLMQINSIHGTYLDPYENVEKGIEMLSALSEKYCDVESVLMAYNFGEGGAQRLWKQGIYSTDYTRSVLDKKLEYERKNRGNL